MKHPVRLERQNGVACIIIENPPVNALSAAVRQGIGVALEAALADDAVTAIVLAANGRTFPAGADISEFGQPAQDPSLPDLCNMVEASAKPVVAALHGTVLGGGLELAMAAHYRIASEDAKMGLPEVNLGLLPGAGGTQRTPRLIGVDRALDLMLKGRPITAKAAMDVGLIDGDAPADDLRDVVTALAAETSEPRPTRDNRTHLTDGTQYMARIQARRLTAPQTPEATEMLNCVEAALLLPFDAGLEMEREAFMERLASPRSAGMRHAFFAERRAAKFDALKDADPLPLDSIGVVGGGAQGSEIAAACLMGGLPVTLVEQGRDGADAAFDRIAARFEHAVTSGRMSEDASLKALSQMHLSTDIADLAKADVIIEALPEDATLKEDTFRTLGKIAKPAAVLASQTAYGSIDPLQSASGRVGDTLALHIAAPLDRFSLVELGVPAGADPAATVTLHALAKRLGKTPVWAQARPGLIGMRLTAAMLMAGDRMLLDGAAPSEIDTAMRDFGMPLGLYQAQDMAGLDLAWSRRKAETASPDPRSLSLADRMCEAGWLGHKVRRGYYLYSEDGGSKGVPNPDMLKLLTDERRAKGVTAHGFTDAQIMTRLRLAIVNTAAQLLEEGTAKCPSDIDTVMIHGHGYPRATGGPLHETDQSTPFEALRAIEALAEDDPVAWQPAPLLRKLAAERARFASLNG